MRRDLQTSVARNFHAPSVPLNVGSDDGLETMSDLEQARVDAPGCGLRNAVERMRLLPAHSDFDDAGIVLDELAHSFAPKTP